MPFSLARPVFTRNFTYPKSQIDSIKLKPPVAARSTLYRLQNIDDTEQKTDKMNFAKTSISVFCVV